MVILKKVKRPYVQTTRFIIEMAEDKKGYQKDIGDLLPQIAQNWCLCKYCQIYRKDLLKTTYLHWKSELETYLTTLNLKSISGGQKQREKWATEEVLKFSNMDNPDVVYRACRNKFNIENSGLNNKPKLGITDKQQKEVCSLFSENIYEIINCIVSQDLVEKYTDAWFPEEINNNNT